ncbi:MAG TPA: HU family DNA-binding protein [Bacteroidales bacterium]|nr:HU family DNA-binding protein [Bacteroidales bacterium]
MNKHELIEALALNCRMTKKTTKRFLEGFMDTLSDTLKEGNDVQLLGFGSFVVTDQKERTVFNPQTKEPIKISAKKVVKFRAGKNLLESVNRNKL